MTEARGGFIPNVLPPPYFTEESFARYICDFNTEVLTTEYEGVWRAMERPALERSEVQQEKEEKEEEEKKDATV
ncbi:hypothetical protein Pmar_PMAR010318 [Perkinsus marinus ATCC 50983]|uniref:Uncharacterized protein n=1 Tax=Perkinsus marinus (strain ATCC 50983 / TXsc) TaxID=423536 RepID=C5KYH3_PERM5|nr:hypothetical protein Pmar_PMAR010318 [Perkinsus marinus ATCC 50983]EER10470.1 hypothetical protein Pmar_PMAR010318 [Perkinsus marinus ATCC 50983]|eukprot:XP_002778675.1 hypothetical protein Pmar_PMAR010318 [Perkinsus marinus ATCC 50983]